MENKQYLWCERYRPRTIDDCVLPESIKKTFKQMIGASEAQNLLLSGGPGCGKTTIARALCNELNADYIIVNCSEDGNIDTLRTKIRDFASTVSLGGGKKVVILDEFDYSNAQSTQPALRGFIEEFANNCRFVLTCNFKNRIIEPIHSRCTCIDFRIPDKEKPKLAAQMMERVKMILETEGIKYEEQVLAELILKHFPDFRRIINEIQRYSVSGTIDIGILSQIGEIEVKSLFSAMKNKEFGKVRKWVVENLDNDQSRVYRRLYDSLTNHVDNNSIPQAILIIGEYMYKSAFVADQEINMVACLIELMMEVSFK